MEFVAPPRRLRFVDEAKTLLAVDWPDGHVGVYPLAYLRGWCPCATCQGHGASASFVPGGAARLAAITPVGNYGVTLAWSDAHATGITTWRDLRASCPCPACGGPREGTPADVAALVPR